MKNFSYTLIFLLFMNFSYSQINVSNAYLFNKQNTEREARKSANSDLRNAIKNSDELNWGKAEIIVNDEPKSIEARYNPFTDEVEIKDKNKITNYAKRNNGEIRFIDTNLTYQSKSYYGVDGKIYMSYFIVDNLPNDLIILKKEGFEKEISNQNKYSSKSKEAFKFVKKDYFFIINKSNELLQLTTDRRIIKNQFPNNSNAIIKYIRANKLNSSNTEDLIILAKYINNL